MARRWYVRLGEAARGQGLPPIFALTDPRRFPDIRRWAEGVAPGWGVIYRHFGAPDRFEIAHFLAKRSLQQGGMLLIAADPGLAKTAGAQGVHWPEARLGEAQAGRRCWPGAVMTAAAHSPLALRRAERAGMNGVFLSPIRRTDSPGAGAPLGLLRGSAMARSSTCPVYALGGMQAHDAAHAQELGFAGIGLVSGVQA